MGGVHEVADCRIQAERGGGAKSGFLEVTDDLFAEGGHTGGGRAQQQGAEHCQEYTGKQRIGVVEPITDKGVASHVFNHGAEGGSAADVDQSNEHGGGAAVDGRLDFALQTAPHKSEGQHAANGQGYHGGDAGGRDNNHNNHGNGRLVQLGHVAFLTLVRFHLELPDLVAAGEEALALLHVSGYIQVDEDSIKDKIEDCHQYRQDGEGANMGAGQGGGYRGDRRH